MNKTTGIERLRKLLATAGLPELGPGPRAGVLPEAELNRELAESLKDFALPEDSRELVRGLVLLWHDRMEAAHEIAQAMENADGSLLHGILHRREPDYGNAAYWFRRAGRHGSFQEMARRTGELLKTKNQHSREKLLLQGGEWDPYAFIGLCEKASGKAVEDASVKLLREIQGIETEVLLEHWFTS